MGRLIEAIGAGQRDVEDRDVLPLREAARAHALLEGRKTTGKLILAAWS